jgi:hypothetical protein
MFTNAIGLNAIQTNSTIQTDILGANSKGVIAKNGKPTYIFTEDKITIYVYKWKFNNLKTRCEIHFYNNKAFLVNYTYNMLTKADKVFITKTITQKYLDRNIDIKDCKITDDNNNVLFINDGMEFKVTYLSTKNSDWYDNMKNDINIKKEKRKAKSKLAEQRLYSKI